MTLEPLAFTEIDVPNSTKSHIYHEKRLGIPIYKFFFFLMRRDWDIPLDREVLVPQASCSHPHVHAHRFCSCSKDRFWSGCNLVFRLLVPGSTEGLMILDFDLLFNPIQGFAFITVMPGIFTGEGWKIWGEQWVYISI